MNKTSKFVGSGIAVMVGSVLALAPVAADAARQHPARICLDDTSSGQCETLVRPSELPGGGGQEVAVRPTTEPAASTPRTTPTTARSRVEYGRLDAKDHPNYGQNTPETGRLDAKDHPNYGQSTSGASRRWTSRRPLSSGSRAVTRGATHLTMRCSDPPHGTDPAGGSGDSAAPAGRGHVIDEIDVDHLAALLVAARDGHAWRASTG